MPMMVRRVWVEWWSSVGRLEALWVSSGGVDGILLLALRPWLVGVSPQWPPLVGRGGVLSPIPKTLGLSLLELALAHGVPWGCLQ